MISRVFKKNPAGCFVSMAFICASVGLIGLIACLYSHHRMEILSAQGTQTDATIERLYRSGGKGPHTPYIAYSFADAQGNSHQDRDAFPFSEWNSLHVGDKISVTYLSSDPSVNAISRRVEMVTHKTLKDDALALGLPWLASLVFFALYLNRKRQN